MLPCRRCPNTARIIPVCLRIFELLQVMEDLAAAQLQQQSIDKEIMLQIARVNTAVSEFESFKASSAEMKRQLEKEALDSEMALVDLQHRYSTSQSELISAKLEVGETLEVARRKAERAALFKYSTRCCAVPVCR
jgi:hypothetical protein